MIVCDQLDWARERHAFHPIVDQAIRWIAASDFSQMETGKYDLLPDNQMFCLLQEMETEPASARRPNPIFAMSIFSTCWPTRNHRRDACPSAACDSGRPAGGK